MWRKVARGVWPLKPWRPERVSTIFPNVPFGEITRGKNLALLVAVEAALLPSSKRPDIQAFFGRLRPCSGSFEAQFAGGAYAPVVLGSVGAWMRAGDTAFAGVAEAPQLGKSLH